MRSRDSSWPRWGILIVALIVAVVIGYTFNLFVAVALIVIIAAIWISRAIQWSEPPEPGE